MTFFQDIKKYKPQIAILGMIYALLFYVPCILDEKLVGLYFLWIPFSIPSPFLFFTFIYPLSNAVTEVYNSSMTWFFLIAGFVVMLIFAGLTIGAIHAPNPAGVKYALIQSDYNLIDTAVSMCMGWGYLAFFLGMFINVKILAKYKIKFSGKHYYRRSVYACCISELVVTVVANVLIWGPRLPLFSLLKLIFFGYIFLLVITPVWVLLGMLIKIALHKLEGEQRYMYNKEFHEHA